MSDFTNFIPRRKLISNISNERQATVTTTEEHGFDYGQWLRLIVPPDYNMTLNYVQTMVVSVPSTTTFVVSLDTTQLNPFTPPSYPPAYTQAQVCPMSGTEINDVTITGIPV